MQMFVFYQTHARWSAAGHYQGNSIHQDHGESSTLLSGEFPHMLLMFYNLSFSIFHINTYFFFQIFLSHTNRSISSTTENDCYKVQKVGKKDQIYFQETNIFLEISKDL